MGAAEVRDNRVYLFDTTLRDGAQTRGVDFTAADKLAIARALDRFGIDYVEAGWPGANPVDDLVFANPPRLERARLTAFGMTRRPGRSSANDPGLAAVLATAAPVACLVGKAWDFQAEVALGIAPAENLALIADSIAHAAACKSEAVFDAEHFFDGYKADASYALACLRAAQEAGAAWLVLCDTNGGTLPHEVSDIVAATARVLPGARLGIHAHDDTGNAVANSLAAVLAGARMVQGTLNGLGERCGNANLIALIPTLMLKLGFETGIAPERLRELPELSRLLDDRLERPHDERAPYVGARAFAHKGGLHVSAILKNPACYEHIDPAAVGNLRELVVSDQSGRANLLARLAALDITVAPEDPRLDALLRTVKEREFEGYAYDGAEASFALLAQRMLRPRAEYFELVGFSVTDARRFGADGRSVTESEATVRLRIGAREFHTVADGNGPVNALDRALRKALEPVYPVLGDMVLSDYRVRILRAGDGSGAMPRVMIESASLRPGAASWRAVGVSTNIIEASLAALSDSYCYKLMRNAVTALHAAA